MARDKKRGDVRSEIASRLWVELAQLVLSKDVLGTDSHGGLFSEKSKHLDFPGRPSRLREGRR
jgi:hypothetical protein